MQSGTDSTNLESAQRQYHISYTVDLPSDRYFVTPFRGSGDLKTDVFTDNSKFNCLTIATGTFLKLSFGEKLKFKAYKYGLYLFYIR